MSTYSIQSVGGKERKILIEKMKEFIEDPIDLLPKKGTFRYLLDNNETLIVTKKKEILLIELENLTIPSLKMARKFDLQIPSVIVDTGAIKFVTNGADIMRPGITKISDDVIEGNILLVCEERNRSPLCIGISLYDSVDMKKMTSGKCIKNIHYLGDKWWQINP